MSAGVARRGFTLPISEKLRCLSAREMFAAAQGRRAQLAAEGKPFRNVIERFTGQEVWA